MDLLRRALLLFFLGGALMHARPVLYTVTGVFGTIQNGGTDLLHLSGQPFRIAGVLDSDASPVNRRCGGNCVYAGQKLALHIPGLNLNLDLAGVPVTLVEGEPGTLTIETHVFWVPFTATVKINLKHARPHAFAPVAIEPLGSTVTYGRGPNRTILGIANGTVSATTPVSARSTGGGAPSLIPPAQLPEWK